MSVIIRKFNHYTSTIVVVKIISLYDKNEKKHFKIMFIELFIIINY